MLVKKRRLLYLGNLDRLGDGALLKRVLHCEIVGGRRQRGGNESTFRTCVKRDLVDFDILPDRWQMENRVEKQWKTLVNKGCDVCLDKWFANKAEEKAKRYAFMDAHTLAPLLTAITAGHVVTKRGRSCLLNVEDFIIF